MLSWLMTLSLFVTRSTRLRAALVLVAPSLACHLQLVATLCNTDAGEERDSANRERHRRFNEVACGTACERTYCNDGGMGEDSASPTMSSKV